MSRSRLSLLFGSLLLLFTMAVWVVILRWAKTVPTALEGDAWDYAILPAEAPAGWILAQHDITTPFDVEQARLEAAASATATAPVTQTAALQNMTQMYAVRYQPLDASPYADFTCQVILYQSHVDARAALAAESPGAEWESLPAPSVGDEARLWHFKNPEPGANQNIYRVDFRYLNSIASATLMGTAQAVPDATEVTAYTSKMFDKMKKAPAPADLKSLQSAGLPDLRRFLLTQEQVAQSDVYLGSRWMWATEQMPGWVPTSSMSEGAQKALKPLGRVMGYQMFFYKSLTQSELEKAMPVLIFQQVTAYKDAANAQKGLDMMMGITQLEEFPNPPQIGDGQTHGWKGELSGTQSDGAKMMVAVSELDFHVGSYVASVKLQSRPLADSEISQVDQANNKMVAGEGLLQVSQLTEDLARTLAENLRKAGK